MSWILFTKGDNDPGCYSSGSYDIESIEDLRHIVSKEPPAGYISLGLAQYRPSEVGMYLAPFDVVLTTFRAGYIVCSFCPEHVFQYATRADWDNAQACFIYRCQVCMEERMKRSAEVE